MKTLGTTARWWLKGFLTYLLLSGTVPWVIGAATSSSPSAEVHWWNFQLAWGLFHCGPAALGICVAAAYAREYATFSYVAICGLVLQAVLSVLDLRRHGFDPRLPQNLSFAVYCGWLLSGAALFAIPWYLAAPRTTGSGRHGSSR